MTNEPYTCILSTPLLRPGLTITVGPFSKKYASEVVRSALSLVREINEAEKAKEEAK